jgi:hypothetical protein
MTRHNDGIVERSPFSTTAKYIPRPTLKCCHILYPSHSRIRTNTSKLVHYAHCPGKMCRTCQTPGESALEKPVQRDLND